MDSKLLPESCTKYRSEAQKALCLKRSWSNFDPQAYYLYGEDQNHETSFKSKALQAVVDSWCKIQVLTPSNITFPLSIMGPKEKKKSNYTIPQTQKMIYIVGPVRCYNSLLASFLESEIGAKCQVFESLGNIPNRYPEDTGQINLVLWDCFGKSVENCYIDYQANENRIIQQDFLALSNISPGLGFEERIMSCGAHGFFYTHDSLEQMVKGVRAIFNGELWISRKIMADHIKKMSNPHHKSNKNNTDLTHREIRVLTMVAAGSKNAVIADKLCISPHTVKTHLYNIFKKINVPNRLQASLWAAKNL